MMGLAVVGVACTKAKGTAGNPTPPATGPSGAPGSINALTAGAQQLSLLSTNTPVNPGKVLFGFDLSTSAGGLVTAGSPQVWIAKDQTSPATGPFQATWHPFTAYTQTGDHSPKSPLPGTYAVVLDVPSTGNWLVAAVAVGVANGARAAGVGALPVTDAKVPAAIGSKAVSVPTPVGTTEAKLKQICTREPPCHLHATSLDAALRNGKPTVVSFATPLLCESQLCGPVVDEQILASQSFGSKANFIHVEEFLPGPDLKPPAPTLANQSPGFKAWSFSTEPWVVVIDRAGVVRARFEGPVTSPQIEAALQDLLT